MNFLFTEEQEMLRATVRRFVDKRIRGEYAKLLDESEEMFVSEELWNEWREMGMFGIGIPEEYGGSGGGLIDEVIINEELARGSAAVAFAYGSAGGFFTRLILSAGTEEQKRFFLPRMAKGEIKFGIAVTEPGGGTDILGALQTIGEQKEGGFVVRGQKVFITNAHKADYLVTLVKTAKDAPRKTKSCSLLIIDTRSPNIIIRPIKKFTIKGASACEVFFEDVWVPQEMLIGNINEGWYALLKLLNPERVIIAAVCNGIAAAALEEMIEYAKQRIAFGRPIGQYQAIQHKVADSIVDLELARLITYKAAWLIDQGQDAYVEAAMAKLVSSEAAFRITTRGLDVLAGYGTTLEYNMQRYFRDSRQCTFAPISNEMVRNLLAESVGLPRSY